MLQVLSNPKVYAFSTPNCFIVVADTAVVLFDPGFQTVLNNFYFGTHDQSSKVNIYYSSKYCLYL